MLAPLKWINDYVKIDDIAPQTFADMMTMSGSKVEELIEPGKEISNVVTGRILKIEKHPHADRLLVCQVDAGSGVIQIVTGAGNVREGNMVPVALHGSSLPGGVRIKRGKLRGMESDGMMCSSLELGLEEEDAVHGIYILPEDTPVGRDVKEVLGLDNVAVDFEITSNRPDCLGMIGLAREASATFGRELHLPEVSFAESGERTEDYIDVEIKDRQLCSRYAARIVKGITIKDSPEWMKERLTAAGVRPINNVVDVTNYVMLEYGQPLHAFDYRMIDGGKIIVRSAGDGERIITLDGKERLLDSSMIVIADTKKALVVAGVMGGENSEVERDTTTVMLESATFNGTAIRMASKKLGFRTEASSRFEKGLDPNTVIAALDRAAQMVAELGGGVVLGGAVDRYQQRKEPWTIDISAKRINRFLGTDISEEDMVRMLESLGIRVIRDGGLKALIPTFRADLENEPDIAEEIARLYGYNNIRSTLISGETTQGGRTREQIIQDIARDVLTGAGMYEVITYSLASPRDFDRVNIPSDSRLRKVVRIANPLSEDLSIMRTTLVPSMLEVMNRNYSKKIDGGMFFEIGKTYNPLDDPKEKLPEEDNVLILGMYGGGDFFNLKGDVELLLNRLGIKKYEFVREADNPTYHPGKTADILCGNSRLGIIGEIHPDVSERYGLPEGVYIAELDFDMITRMSELGKKFKKLPKYPAVERDIALLVPEDVMCSQIEGVIRRTGGALVESVKLFDVYTGKQVPEGKKSIAYSVVYRSDSGTLVDEEVNGLHQRIVEAVKSELGAQLRL